jgi:lipoprotein NlpD
VAPFGTKDGRVSSKGIVIVPKTGDTQVLAAASGRVVWIDEKMKGYGKTIILEHPSDFATIYARNSQILVKHGQSVQRGEAIAKLEGGGHGLSPGLYFEIRRQAKAENPAKYLPLHSGSAGSKIEGQ